MTQSMEQRVIQISNVASTITVDQLQTLFSHVGSVEDCRLYPSDDQPLENGTRICYVKFQEAWSVGVAMHLSNTLFMERPLMIFPMNCPDVPDEEFAIAHLAPGAPISSTCDELPELSAAKKLTNEISTNAAGAQVINTIDPSLALKGAPNYPALPAGLSDENVEEIRRTIYVGNLDPNLTNEMVLKFFSQCGEIKYVRMGGEAGASMKHAFVEFTDQSSVGNAFQFNGTLLGTRAMVVSHSSTAIIKPKAADPRIAAEPVQAKPPVVVKPRSRSRSKTRRKSRSTSRRRKSPRRSRSRSKGRKRSRSRERRRSRDRRRSRSRKRSRSRRRSRERRRSKDRKERTSSPAKSGPKTPEGSGPMTPPDDPPTSVTVATPELEGSSVDDRAASTNQNGQNDNSLNQNGKSEKRDNDDEKDRRDRSKRKSRSRSRDRRRRSRSRERRRRSVTPKRKRRSTSRRRSTSKRRSRSRDTRRRRSRSKSRSVDRRRRSRSTDRRRRRSRSTSRDRRRSRSRDRRDRRRSRTPEKKPPPPPPRDYDEEERVMTDPHNPATVAASIIAPLAPMGPAPPPPPPPPPPPETEDMDLSD